MQSSADVSNLTEGDKTQSKKENLQSGVEKADSQQGNVQSGADNLDSEGENTLEDAASAKTKETDQSDDPQMVWLKRYFAKALGICFEPPPECLLDEVSFEGIARYIASEKCNKIVVMTGAGISTSAGIPDFRSPGTGCYEQLKKEYNIENPQELFTYSFFKDNPEPYYKYRKELWRCTYKPTPCHYFVRLLEKKNKLLRHFTQNIDGLETLAGISGEKLIQAHGTMATAHCMECGQSYSQEWVKSKIFGLEGPVPRCDNSDCGGLVRPDIVMFGESLPDRFREHITDIDDCDLLLIMGTSLVVQPFANLPIRTKDNVPRLYINLELRETSNHPVSVLCFGGGFDFEKEDNIRDVFWQGKCDEGCHTLADLAGWGDELRTLVKEEHTRLNIELGIKCDSSATNRANVSNSIATGKTASPPAQKQSTGAVQKHATGAVPKQGIETVQKHNTKLIQKPANGAAQKPSTGTANKQGSGAAEKHRTGGTNKQGNGAAQKPSTGTANKQGCGAAEKHRTGGANKQENGAAQKPLTGTANKQGSRAEQNRGTGTAQKPDSRAEQRKMSGTVHRQVTGETQKQYKNK